MMLVIIIVGSFVIGSVVSSFLNLVGYRVPNGVSIVLPNSHCGVCKKELQALDLIPVVSCLVNKGKCRYCGEYYGIMHAFLELYVATLFAVSSIILLENIYLSLVLFLFVVVYNLNRVSKDVHGKILFKTTVVLTMMIILSLILNGDITSMIVGVVVYVLLVLTLYKELRITKNLWLSDIYVIISIIFTIGVFV